MAKEKRRARPAASDSGTSTWWIWVLVVGLVVVAGAIFAVRRAGRPPAIEGHR